MEKLKEKNIAHQKQKNTPELDLMHQANQLIFNYTPVNSSSIFDICDINGTVLLTGKVDASGVTSVPTDFLPKDNYCLCIIDGETLLKHPVEIT